MLICLKKRNPGYKILRNLVYIESDFSWSAIGSNDERVLEQGFMSSKWKECYLLPNLITEIKKMGYRKENILKANCKTKSYLHRKVLE